MTFISYAQNREDVLLWRALGHIKNGFYIDVGANDPDDDSVTRAFYQSGWWGINIEPVPSLHQRLLARRPRDVNLGIAAGAAAGTLTLFDLPEVNGWATASGEVAEAHRADGHRVVESQVAVRTLAEICAEHVRADIHFLKIDVEGFEEQVLRGMDFGRWRPWVLVVEATMPNSRETNHEQWEALVTGQGYRYAWFDGLNRYYVAQEKSELMAALSLPPNVFDDFIPAQLDKAWGQLTELSRLNEQAGQQLHDAKEHAKQQLHDAQLRAGQQMQQHDSALRAQRLEQAREVAELGELHQRRLDAALAGALEAVQAAAGAMQLAAGLDERARRAELERDSLQALYAEEQAALARAHQAHHDATTWARGIEQRLIAIEASSSWRITAPWRWLGGLRHSLRPRPALRRLALWAMRQPRLRTLALRLIRRYPALGPVLRGQVAALVNPPPPVKVAQYVPPAHLVNVPVSARKVLLDLAQERLSNPAGKP